MFFISKEFHFSASHQLSKLPLEHPCARLHGHNYKAKLILKDKNLNEYGFVQDFRNLDFFKKYIDEEIDHRHLNDVFSRDDITSEFLSYHFFHYCVKKIPQLYSVEVSETPKTWAIYSPFSE